MPSKPKSEVVSGIDRVQSSIVPLMKTAGFCKRGRSFNRMVDEGIVHVLNFQAGQYPIGDNYVIPGLRESMYGNFAVNLGVHLPEVYALENNGPTSAFLQEYDCSIRERLGTLVTEGNDLWWSATDSIQDTSERFPSLFDKFALPFFARFDSRQSVIKEWKAHGKLPFCNPGRSNLIAAILLHAQKKKVDASTALRDAISSNEHKGFHRHVRSIAGKLGLTL